MQQTINNHLSPNYHRINTGIQRPSIERQSSKAASLWNGKQKKEGKAEKLVEIRPNEPANQRPALTFVN